MNDIIELVILLTGNFVVVQIQSSQKKHVSEEIKKAKRDGKHDPLFFIQLGDATVFSENIVGFYFRPKAEAPSDKLMKFMDKKLPDNTDDTEDWKKG